MTLHQAETTHPDSTPAQYAGADRKTNRRAKRARPDIYQSVTDCVIAELEAGTVPWVKPWGVPDVQTPFGLPSNGQTGNTYSGINILLLWAAAIDTCRTTQVWLTYRQAQAVGGQVRKGERGTAVCYADTFIPKAEKLRAQETGEDAQKIGFLKRYTVFNADQCEGLPDALYIGQTPLPGCEAIPQAETLIDATGADFRIGGERAYYVPSDDYIQVPHQSAYFEHINYYRTCFHELGHWTGSPKRLDRNLKGKFGSKDYAREELVAEMTTAFVCAALGIVPTVRHADYLASWLKVLREDKRAIFRAASMASKAADFILAFNKPDTPQSQNMEIAQ